MGIFQGWVNPNLGGMTMESQQIWQLFMETGAPEMYLLYQKAKRMEEPHVFEGTGSGASDYTLQG